MDSKQQVIAALTAHLEAELRGTDAAVGREDAAARLDPDTPFSVDDQSQSGEAADLGGIYAQAGERQGRAIAALEGMDFSPATEVRPGAIVVLDGDHYVVGVISSAFECDGVTYEGMATDALLYEALKGLRTGDTFTFAGMDYHIDAVS